MKTTENKRRIGNIGEDAVVYYLVEHGCHIVKRNYTVKGGEIDIIAETDDELLFVEVKLRRGENERPAEAVGEKKLARMTYAAECYIRAHDYDATMLQKKARFDVAEVYAKGETVTEIRYLKNIFADL